MSVMNIGAFIGFDLYFMKFHDLGLIGFLLIWFHLYDMAGV